ncbi:uncharacterized protein DSM5745_04486 [Aspergillus mulundensis]|uniref:Uncharacterized protein n=1 Tax=Aspergillus mulundensis TaxID=1810919 RepID=A0A3D8SCU0_9EURO|nr:hypothetical protein DSM5745_04486 [Aspergillus mulundensis]RDW84160.1 hypothetical protein DSM5745_04486 [Aspergillus mulundensis]
MDQYQLSECIKSPRNPTSPAPMAAQGAKICCIGEQQLCKSPAFVSVHTDSVPWIKNAHSSLSSISTKLGIPLRLWKYPNQEGKTVSRGGICGSSNQNAAYLMMEVDISKPGWGWAPPYWNTEIGSVFVAREDGKDLAVHDLQMICQFVVDQVQPKLETTLEKIEFGRDSSARARALKQQAVDIITWENVLKNDERNTHVAAEYQKRLAEMKELQRKGGLVSLSSMMEN